MREQWPCHFEGAYEWDYYYRTYFTHTVPMHACMHGYVCASTYVPNPPLFPVHVYQPTNTPNPHNPTESYKTAILHPSVRPSLPARVARLPGQPHTHTVDAGRREAATILARLALPGDTVLLRAGPGGAALGFKPGALPEGVTLKPAAEECGEGEEGWGLAAFWVHAPPCYLITLAKGGREAHEALLDVLLTTTAGAENEDGSKGGHSPTAAAGGSSSSSSPSNKGGGVAPASPKPGGVYVVPHDSLLREGEWPKAELGTGEFAGYAQAAVERCIQEGVCTFTATGSSWMHQVP